VSPVMMMDGTSASTSRRICRTTSTPPAVAYSVAAMEAFDQFASAAKDAV
jgi:hypothetical protein